MLGAESGITEIQIPGLRANGFGCSVHRENKGEIRIDKREMLHRSALDAQKKHGKTIYGSGFLISHTAAERVAAERAAVKKEAIVWELSEREMRIVEKLSGQ